MAKQTVTAFFDDRENANNAVLLLRRYAIPDRDVTVSPKEAATGFAEEMPVQVRGFWRFLDRLFGGGDECHVYAEGVRRGHVMVVAHIDDGNVGDAVSILERHGAIDLSQREGAWRKDGWTGGSTVATSEVPHPDGGSPPPVAAVFRSRAEEAAAGVLATSSARDAYRSSSRPAHATSALPRDRIVLPEAQGSNAVEPPSRAKGKVRISPYLADEQRSHGAARNHPAVGEERNEQGTGHGSAALGQTAKVQRAAGLEVVGCDGQHVGIIDHVEGITIRLKRLDPASGGPHRSIPTSWVQSIDDRVTLKLTAADAMSRWSIE